MTWTDFVEHMMVACNDYQQSYKRAEEDEFEVILIRKGKTFKWDGTRFKLKL